MKLARAIARNIGVVLVGKAGVALLGLGTIVLLTRALGASGFGQYRTVTAYLGFAAFLGDLGISLIVLREISREGADQARTLGNALALRFATAAVMLLGAALVAAALPYEPVVRQGIGLGVIGFAALSGHHLLLGIFQQRLQQWAAATAELAGAALLLGMIWALVRTGAGVLPIIGAMVVGNLVMFGVSWALARRLLPIRLRFEPAEWRRLLVAALPLAGTTILNLVYLRADAVLLSVMKPAADVGIYAVAYKALESFTILPLVFAGLIMPLLSRTAHRDPALFHRYLSGALDAMSIGTVGTAVLVHAFAPQIIGILGGDEFLPAASPLRILVLALAIVPFSVLVTYAVVALGRQRSLLKGYAAAAAVGLTAYLLLIPPLSYRGAAWGTVLAVSTILAAASLELVRAHGRLPSLVALGKALAAGAVTLIALGRLAGLGVPWPVRALLGGFLYLTLLALQRTVPREVVTGLLGRERTGAMPG